MPDAKLFSARNGWLSNFKIRHIIIFCTLWGEGRAVDNDVCSKWKSTLVSANTADYSPCDIFSADKTGLIFKCLANKSITLFKTSMSCMQETLKDLFLFAKYVSQYRTHDVSTLC